MLQLHEIGDKIKPSSPTPNCKIFCVIRTLLKPLFILDSLLSISKYQRQIKVNYYNNQDERKELKQIY